ncbi:CCN family member 3 [Latimeria chalumnae]|nr:PREDICTED: protein NOV homolog [Latimeria chalumnae]|eukprot:XP_005994608.1 PREDICTED: protein NOV homolog [Latimeria chalumnae]
MNSLTKHASLLLFVLLEQVSAQGCPSQCKCPEHPPACTPGAQLVLDGCACCRVCARQQGESCSEENPCDENKGLFCDYAADPRYTMGVCIAYEGDSCVFDGVIYTNGETFQPSCKYICTCTDGQVGCVPRCNVDVLLPGPDCAFPRKVKVPGECCERWVCDPKEASALGGVAMAAYRQEDTLGVDGTDSSLNCIKETTEWSACSKSCGMGISTRVTNRNRRCEMMKQTRLCMVRPCEEEDYKQAIKKGKKCLRTKKTFKSINFEYKNCTSVQMYKPRFCGICTDGRCCTPHSTKTTQIEFQCPGGKNVKKPMMVINTCACHHNCPQDNAFFQMSEPMLSGLKM